MGKDLTDVFKTIKENIIKSGKNYNKMIEQGDLFIPCNSIFGKDLKPNEKIYISCYYIYDKDIRRTDCYMLKILSKNQIREIKNKLYKLHYIEKIELTDKELKEKTIELSHKGNVCEWCGNESYILQEHHYPIQKKDGGKKIVNICPNCHYTFHYLKNTKGYK